MSIIISNISPEHLTTGINDYKLMINNKLICTFSHNRTHDGLAQCLRDAARAVDSMEDALGPREDKSMSSEQLEKILTWMQENKDNE